MMGPVRSLETGLLSRLASSIEAVFDGLDVFFQRGPRRRLVRAMFYAMRDHHSAGTASAMAFDLFLAAIPMIALSGWVFAALLRRDPRAVWTISNLLELTPRDVHSVLELQITRFNEVAVAPVVLLVSLWIASGAFHTVMNMLEAAFSSPPRPWWHKRLIAIACVLFALFAVALSGTIAVLFAGGPLAFIQQIAGEGVYLSQWVGLFSATATAALLTAAFFSIAVRRHRGRRRVWPGALLTVWIGLTASYGFGAWVSRLGRYAVFYGSLAAVAVVLLWLWMCCAALLVGAELNAQLERLD